MFLTRGKSLEAPIKGLREAVAIPISSAEEGHVLDERVVRIVKRTIDSLEAMRPNDSKRRCEEAA